MIAYHVEDKKRIEDEFGEEDPKVLKRKLEDIKLHNIGESSRSTFERAWKHENRRDKLHTDSHILKHILDIHYTPRQEDQ